MAAILASKTSQAASISVVDTVFKPPIEPTRIPIFISCYACWEACETLVFWSHLSAHHAGTLYLCIKR